MKLCSAICKRPRQFWWESILLNRGPGFGNCITTCISLNDPATAISHWHSLQIYALCSKEPALSQLIHYQVFGKDKNSFAFLMMVQCLDFFADATLTNINYSCKNSLPLGLLHVFWGCVSCKDQLPVWHQPPQVSNYAYLKLY